MGKITLNVTKCDKVGENNVDKLRLEKAIPGTLYTREEELITIQAVEKDLQKVVAQVGTSILIGLNLDGENEKILFKEVQMHPFKNQTLHFDAYAANMKEELCLSIPVVLLNRDETHAQPSVLLQHLDEVKVECLPGLLPSAAEADVQNLEIGGALSVKDLDVTNEEGIDVITDLEEAVCTLQEPREEGLPEEGGEDAADTADVPAVDETKEADEE